MRKRPMEKVKIAEGLIERAERMRILRGKTKKYIADLINEAIVDAMKSIDKEALKLAARYFNLKQKADRYLLELRSPLLGGVNPYLIEHYELSKMKDELTEEESELIKEMMKDLEFKMEEESVKSGAYRRKAFEKAAERLKGEMKKIREEAIKKGYNIDGVVKILSEYESLKLRIKNNELTKAIEIAKRILKDIEELREQA